MKHLKSRNGACHDLELTFDKPLQRFAPRGFEDPFPPSDAGGKLQSALAKLWGNSPADQDEDWGPR